MIATICASWILACALGVQSDAGASVDCAAASDGLREALKHVRAGESSWRERLRRSAEVLARDCDRPEASKLAAHFLQFDDAELVRGSELEERVVELRKRYEPFAQLPEHQRPDGWLARLMTEADALAAEGALAAEKTVGLRAAAVAAWLRLVRVEADPTLAPAERGELAARAQRDNDAALAGLEATGQTSATLEPRWVAGRLARWRGDRARARACFERCLADAERVNSLRWQIGALRGLRTLARDAGDLPLEERTLLELARLEADSPTWALAREWTSVLLSTDHADEALAFLARNEALAKEPEDRVDWRFLTGLAALRRRDLATARKHLEAALSGRADAAAVFALARLELAEGRASDAVERLETQLDPDGLDTFGEAQRRALLGEAALAVSNPARARDELFQALAAARKHERALAASPLDATAPARGDNVIGEWLGVHSVVLLALALVELGQPLDAARIVEEYQSRALRRSVNQPPRLREVAGLTELELSTDDVRAWAASRRAGLLTWAIGPNFGVVLHVAADGSTHGARIALGRTAVAELVRRFEDACVAGDDAWAAVLGASLAHALLPEPVATALARQPDDAQLLCLPHGVLEPLPLERLVLAGRALEERFVLSILPGLPAGRPKAPKGQLRWAFLGAPSKSRAAPLPSAKAELEALAARTPDSTLAVGDAFTRETLLAALDRGGAVWIATHALRANDSGSRFAPVGLEVSGGDVVDADELYRRAGALELVVLSSCASAGGRLLDAEGLQGLARALLDAGARDVVATLRPVGDRAAHEFALAFRSALAAGTSRAAAVRAARRALAAAGFPSADWTAFRLLGQD
ncbi:MAG: CHAT domain-containing protein [Planctomycetes bacterium]|nr:CHAT domain-containing protein [Planctomycetota bacterium]